MVTQVTGAAETVAAVVASPPVTTTPGATVLAQPPIVPVTVASEVTPLRAPLSGEVEDLDVTGPAPAIVGPPGPARSYQHVQTTAAATWTVQHGLGIFVTPTLRRADAPDEPVFADVRFVDGDNVIIEWPEPVAGWADF